MHKVLQSHGREGGSWGRPYNGGNGWADLKDEEELGRWGWVSREKYFMPNETLWKDTKAQIFRVCVPNCK